MIFSDKLSVIINCYLDLIILLRILRFSQFFQKTIAHRVLNFIEEFLPMYVETNLLLS